MCNGSVLTSTAHIWREQKAMRQEENPCSDDAWVDGRNRVNAEWQAVT